MRTEPWEEKIRSIIRQLCPSLGLGSTKKPSNRLNYVCIPVCHDWNFYTFTNFLYIKIAPTKSNKNWAHFFLFPYINSSLTFAWVTNKGRENNKAAIRHHLKNVLKRHLAVETWINDNFTAIFNFILSVENEKYNHFRCFSVP